MTVNALWPVSRLAGAWTYWMVAMSWQICAFAILIGVIAALGRRSSASFRYALWFLVFIKLIAPPSTTAPWSPGTLLASVPIHVEWNGSEATPEGKVDSSDAAPASAREPLAVEATPKPRADSRVIIMTLWLVGSVGLFGTMLVQKRSYAKAVMRMSEPASDSLRAVFESERASMAIGSRVRLCVSSVVTTPGVFGVWNPIVLWPSGWAERLDRADIESILAHELAHVKRRDTLVAWFAAALSCLYWFHPVVWVANLLLRREREMACDDMALRYTGREPGQYASAILRVAESFRGGVPMGAGLLGLLELSDSLLYRVRSIGDDTRARRLGWVSVVLLAGLIGAIPMAPWRAAAAVAQPPSAVVGTVTEPTNAVAPATPVASATPVAPAALAVVETPTIALIEFSRAGSTESLKDVSAQMYELLTERLVNAPGVRMVERGALDKAMQEVKLGESGMVDAATAAHVGRLTGARLLIAGRIMAVDAHWIVTARLINTQTSELAAIRAEADAAEGVQILAERTSAAIIERLKGSPVSSASADPGSALDGRLEALRTRLTGRDLPRVVVAVPESHIGQVVPDPAGENEIISVLSRVGFPVVDVSTFMKRPESGGWLNLFFGPAQGREGQEVNVRQGFRSAGDILHDARLEKIRDKADLFIVGEAFSERGGEMNGFVSCKARVEVKALDTTSESVAVASSQHAAAADTAEFIAGKKALRTAGGELAVDLAGRLADYWEARTASRK